MTLYLKQFRAKHGSEREDLPRWGPDRVPQGPHLLSPFGCTQKTAPTHLHGAQPTENAVPGFTVVWSPSVQSILKCMLHQRHEC